MLSGLCRSFWPFETNLVPSWVVVERATHASRLVGLRRTCVMLEMTSTHAEAGLGILKGSLPGSVLI